MAELGFHEDIPETGITMEENSLLKAEYLYERVGVPVIADDSGLEVKALNGEPGVYSARYSGVHGDHQANNELLLNNLTGVEDRAAQFRCVITYLDKNEKKQFEGIIRGEISHELTGTQGFGYDPLFVPEGFDLTFAELDPQVKNGMSHRGRAIEKLAEYLNGKK